MKSNASFSSALLALSLCGLSSNQARAAYVIVDPSDFATFNLDIDGDSEPEISTISRTTGSPLQLVVSIATDLPNEFQFPGGFGMPGGSAMPGETNSFSQYFASISDLMNADIYSGTASLTLSAQYQSGSTAYSDIVGYISSPLSTPVIATWLWGTSGRGPTSSDPVLHHLVGWVIDASAYAIDDSQPITIYYHNYGTFPEGQSTQVSLTATSIPEPHMLLFFPGLLIPLLWRRRS